MKIKRMRLVLPARMSTTAQLDAREIAKAAAKALQGDKGAASPLRVQVQGQGQPATLLAQSVYRAMCQQRPVGKKGG